MNDTTSNTPASSQPTDWYTNRMERRMAHNIEPSAERHDGTRAAARGWPGLVLIALGGMFMLQNMGMVVVHNAWALLILIPAAGSFATAFGSYRVNGGRLNAMARGSLISGLIFVAIAAFFLFDLDWGKWWPTLLILAGVGALTNAALPD
ncbi:MAG: hypothetical protein U0559_17630 [Anaerolineae bacterium]